MKTRLLTTVLVLFAALAATARADEFSDLAHSPNAYWVPPAVVYAPPPGYYGNPPPVYYYAPPPPAVRFYFHFHSH